MESHKDERVQATAAGPISVIYVSVEEPQPAGWRGGEGPARLLRAAAVCLHMVADQVDDLRRSLERHRL